MEYSLLNNGQGVLTSRGIEVVNGDLLVTFLGSCRGSVAIFENGEISIYKTLDEGRCVIPREKIKAGFSVKVIKYDGTVMPPVWECEGIKFVHFGDGEIMVCHADRDIPAEVSELKIVNHNLREDFEALQRKFEELNGAFISMMEGYDLT